MHAFPRHMRVFSQGTCISLPKAHASPIPRHMHPGLNGPTAQYQQPHPFIIVVVHTAAAIFYFMHAIGRVCSEGLACALKVLACALKHHATQTTALPVVGIRHPDKEVRL